MAHGKRYRQQYGKVQRGRAYPPGEAVSLIKETASAGFDETVELHLLLGLNVRHAEEQLRGTLALPHGLGKDVTVAVFAQGQQARDAEAAGADFVGSDDLAKKVEEGWTDFDVAIATPQMMGTVGKLGRVLGPQGKMPNPKVGTVTDDVEKAVEASKSGKVEYRTDRQAIVHMTIGKASFDADKLLDNYTAVIDEIVRAKPASAKGKYIKTATLTTTMGPGIRVDSGKAGDAPGPKSAAAEAAGPADETPAGHESEAEEPAVDEPSEGEENAEASAEDQGAEEAATA
jgi:large subunit ribosomal protein L1